MAQASFHIACATEASWSAPLDLRISGLRPGEGLSVCLSLRDSAGVVWRSEGRFLADTDGAVDLRTPSRGGTWMGADPEGWWWSMRPQGWRNDHEWMRQAFLRPSLPVTPMFDPDAEAELTISVITRGRIDWVTQRRLRLPRGVTTRDPAPIAGRAYLPRVSARAAVLLIGGSEGGIPALRAAQLAGRGVAVLAQAWHGWPGTPDAPANCPIEQFEAGLRWLRRHTGVDRPAVWGSSRGSEAAVLLADKVGRAIGRLILWVPTHLSHGALAPGSRDFRDERDAMWTIAGAPISPIRWDGPHLDMEQARAEALGRLPGWRASDHYAMLWSAAGAEKFALPTLGIRAPTLLVAGADDGLWPSATGAMHLHRRLAPYVSTKLRIFDDVGHTIPVPGDPIPFVRTRIWRGQFGVESGYIDVGGEPAATAAAARASFEEAVSFLITGD